MWNPTAWIDIKALRQVDQRNKQLRADVPSSAHHREHKVGRRADKEPEQPVGSGPQGARVRIPVAHGLDGNRRSVLPVTPLHVLQSKTELVEELSDRRLRLVDFPRQRVKGHGPESTNEV
jgi:hypothetical protein